MKSFLLVLLSVSLSFCSTLIYDFAPMDSGAKWVYSYIYYNSWMGQSLNLDSFTISIKLAFKEARGNDTLVFLNIREQGRSIATSSPGSVIFDTTSDMEFVDTAVVSSDSIIKPAGYRCKVFPFWNTHGIAIDYLSKTLFGNDSLYFLKRSFVERDYYTYLQGFGFYQQKFTILTHRTQITTIDLISFNDRKIPASTIRPSIKGFQRPQPSGYFVTVNTSKQRSGRTNPLYFLNGIKAPTRGIIPVSVFVQRQPSGTK